MAKTDYKKRAKFYGFLDNDEKFVYIHKALNRKHMRAIMFNNLGKRSRRNVYRVTDSAVRIMSKAEKETPISALEFIKL